ncbi:MAG TPA: homoserine O-succinyltransferase [Rhizomicrobium sp.]|nr:homoserine O-succinyltransferase [Rhizomicrobium sp.]
MGAGRSAYRGTIHVGLVNDMPDTALRATELQYARLLKEASGALDVQLRFFSLSQVVRGELARSRMEGFYADADTLPTAGIDALIVTGAEPCGADLPVEGYRDALTRLVDWAEIGTISSVFSCPAAHAAVLHRSGIAPLKLPRKLSGVFTAECAGGHPLQTGMQARIQVPHSRRDTIAESDLVSQGYRILSRLSGGGVDSFARTMPGRSLFLFLQGHPEYGAETLGREYLRDMGRFLRGESDERPAVPECYFDRATEYALAALDASPRGSDDLEHHSGIISGALPLQSWRSHTIKLFGNWLALVAAEKMRRVAHPPARKKLRA